MIRVKIKEDSLNKNVLAFGCKGFGWIKESELNEKYITVQLEDDYNGARGYSFNLSDLIICEDETKYPY